MTTKPAEKPPRKAPGTPTRPFRVADTLWNAFGDAAEQMGTTRTALVLNYMRWMTREPGAKLPRRPDARPAASSE